MLLVADLLALLAACLVFRMNLVGTIALTLVLLVCRANARVYRRRLRLSYVDDFPRSVASVAAAFGLSVAIFIIRNDEGPKDADIVFLLLTFIAFSEILRIMVFAASNYARRKLGRGDRALVLGTDHVGVDLVRKMQNHPQFGLRPVGLTQFGVAVEVDNPPVPVLEGDLASIIKRHHIGTLILAQPAAPTAATVEASIIANRLGCAILMLPRLYDLYRDSPDVERLFGYPLVRLTADPTRRMGWWVKRGFDILVASIALLILTPLLLATGIAVLIESGRPLIFKQERIGLDGRPFVIYKLRSMKPSNSQEAQSRWSIAGDSRVGPVGRFLRRTSFDELPQLWNIILGDMSIVGPRPERPGFVAEFTEKHEGYGIRHRVPVGLTGLAQINGLRGDTSIADRARFDNYYIANWSLWLDVKIMLLTMRETLRRGQH